MLVGAHLDARLVRATGDALEDRHAVRIGLTGLEPVAAVAFDARGAGVVIRLGRTIRSTVRRRRHIGAARAAAARATAARSSASRSTGAARRAAARAPARAPACHA